MKKIFTLLAVAACLCVNAQTTLYSNDFTAGGTGWSLGQGGNFDFWIVNNVYNCTSTTPDQGGGNYMHIYDDLFADYCAHSGFLGSGSGGTVHSTMSTGIITTGFTDVTLTFDWLCQGQTGPVLSSYGFVDFSVDGGSTWTNCMLPLAKYNGQPLWTTGTISTNDYPSMGNQADLRFRFGFTNSGYGTNPAFAVDNIFVVDTAASGLNVDLVQSSNTFHVFPNPTAGIFTVQFAAVNAASVVTVTDMLGKAVRTIPVSPGISSMNVDLTGLERGIYFVDIISEGQRNVKRVVLQ